MAKQRVNNNTPSFPWEFPGETVYFFRANNRFLHEIEQADEDARSYQNLVFDNDGTMNYWHRLFWALTSTHRFWEDPECTFEEFLDMLPAGPDMTKLQRESMRIITDFFRTERTKEVKPINTHPESEEPDEGNLLPVIEPAG